MTKRSPNDAPQASGLGRRFRIARDKANLTQRALAAKARRPLSAISDIEGDRRMPQIDTLEVLARALGVPAGWLAYGDDTPPEWWTEPKAVYKAPPPPPRPPPHPRGKVPIV